MAEPAGGRSGLGTELAVLTAVVGVETFCAVRAFPQMDDAYLLLLLKERGAAAVAAAHRDRPLVGAIWQALAAGAGSSFWGVVFAAHFVLWLALGLLSCRIWRRLFPGWERYAVVAGAAAVAPIVVRTQFSTATISLLGVLSVVPVWAAVLLAWRFAESGRRVLLAAALAMAAAGALVSEYGVVAGVAGAVLLGLAAFDGPADRGRARASALALAAVAVACYGAYVAVGNFAARPLVDPARQLGRAALVIRTPFNVVTRFWDAVVGDLCRAAGAFHVEWQSKSTLVALAAGFSLATALWRAAGIGASDAAPDCRRRSLLALAASLAAGLLPIALMRPVFRSAFASRFEIPILPLAASLSVALALSAVQACYRPAVAAGFGLLIGMAMVQEAGDALRQRGAMAAIAARLEPLVRENPGLTLAVLADPGLCYTAQVCTGSITRSWPTELGRRLWVETAEEASAGLGRRGACTGNALSGLSERGFERGAPSGPPIWLELGDRAPHVEPYCGPDRHPAVEGEAR